ncbi:hypothetical protein OG936_01020 [Streptomyces sp. NBC_00846]|uniref:hypothetical protein n=1 Tax=Streptomyces sp. NBC_00846 TaxID=2975849 RepID=UPI0038688FBA|nr:hypothetical protein OG936_01020 [Streptomyces sp. NBC_00846]
MDGSGKTAYCQPGGLVSAIAYAAEEKVLEVAAEDVARARALAVDKDVTRAELISALLFLSHSCLAVIDVAGCRLERAEQQLTE